MLPWMQIYDNDKYGQHHPDFCAVIDTLPTEQASFMESGMFAQSMTGNPYSCVALVSLEFRGQEVTKTVK